MCATCDVNITISSQDWLFYRVFKRLDFFLDTSWLYFSLTSNPLFCFNLFSAFTRLTSYCSVLFQSWGALHFLWSSQLLSLPSLRHPSGWPVVPCWADPDVRKELGPRCGRWETGRALPFSGKLLSVAFIRSLSAILLVRILWESAPISDRVIACKHTSSSVRLPPSMESLHSIICSQLNGLLLYALFSTSIFWDEVLRNMLSGFLCVLCWWAPITTHLYCGSPSFWQSWTSLPTTYSPGPMSYTVCCGEHSSVCRLSSGQAEDAGVLKGDASSLVFYRDTLSVDTTLWIPLTSNLECVHVPLKLGRDCTSSEVFFLTDLSRAWRLPPPSWLADCRRDIAYRRGLLWKIPVTGVRVC